MKLDLHTYLRPISGDYSPLTPEQAREVERLVGFELPASYTAFASDFGGGGVFQGEATVKTDDGRELAVFTIFGGVALTPSVLEDLKAHPEWQEAGLIPIADDMFNNRFLLECRTGKIHFIEYSEGVSRAFEVAPSFEAFVERVEVVLDE
ncbi:SMI1/KNR4 family protein [Cycloclasticus pugetii]|uniref:SMI1/KNR4 family protein n=1 Tax=Cycloclasticus pugetii TaxID=34068 RepID=UPI003A941BD0